MSDLVLDSSAVLALLKREPGGEMVASALDGAVMSAVNQSEVLGKLVDDGVPLSQAEARLRDLPVALLEFNEDDAVRAAALRRMTREAGLSLGDRACLALALRLNLPVLTADRNRLRVDVGAKVRSIR
jgi:PIN domain nuclease of toxin-antitoxin system